MTPRPLTIAWINSGHDADGVGQAVLNLSGALTKLGHQTPQILLDEGPFAAQCRTAGLPCTALHLGPPPVLTGNLLGKARAYARLVAYKRRSLPRVVEALRASRPDVIHFVWPNLVGLAGRAAREMGVPVFWEMPNIIGDTYPFALNRRILQRQLYQHRITPLANSAYTAGTLGDRPVRPLVFYLGADAARFDPDRRDLLRKAQVGVPEDSIVLAITARLTPEKGPGRVLQAMLAVNNAPQPLHLLLIGPGEPAYLDSLRRMAAAANASDRLHILPYVPDPERYYGAIDVAINAYEGAEGFGLAVVEAMLMAKPVLVHALGGPAETVINNITGWHVHEPSVKGLAAGLRRALADRSRWTELGRAGRKRAMEYFTAEVQAKAYLDLLSQRLGNGILGAHAPSESALDATATR